MIACAQKVSRIARLASIFVFAVLLSETPSFALDPARNLTQYNYAIWQDRDGLPQNTVQAITQTSDGYLWVGTETGLARFDGASFTLFDRRNTPALRNNSITALYEGRDGSLWIGTRGGGLTRFTGGKFVNHTQDEGLAHNSVRAIIEDMEGALWIGTNDGLSRFKDGAFVTYRSQDGLGGNGVRAFCVDREGRLWIGTTGGVALLKDGRFTRYTAREGLPENAVRAICEDREGRLWIGTQNRGVARFVGGRFETFNTRGGLSSDYIRALRADGDGNIWIGTFGGGLSRFSRGRFSAFTIKQGLSSNIVRSLYEDREGNLWVGTEGGGLGRFNNGKLTTYTTRDGLSHDFARAIRQDSQGRIWVGTEGGGLNCIHDGRITAFTTQDGMSSNFVTSIYEYPQGRIWAGTLSGLNCIEGARIKSYGVKDGLPSSSIWAISSSSDGSLWIGTPGGLSRFLDGRFTNYTEKNGLPDNYVRALYQDRAGRLWIGFRDHGLARFEDNQFVVYKAEDGLPDASITSFHEDREGALWIGTSNGLARFKNDRFIAITTRDGLFHDNIYQALEDQAGRLWMTSSSGIFYVAMSDLSDLADGKASRVDSVSFTTADGMKSSECSGEAQPAGWLARDGKLWFPTVKGVVALDPLDIKTNSLLPQVHIEQVIVDQKPVSNENLSLAPGTKEVEFRYTGLSFVAPERVRFKYRLEGLDDQDWIEAGTRRQAFFTNLPPGRYRFRVIASNNDGVWNDIGASIEFYQRPRFYQTTAFLIACGATLALIGWGIYRARVRQIRKQFEAVSAERNRIAREWHDTLVAGFAAISWQLETSANQLPESITTARQHLEVARRMVKHSLTEARRALWDLRSDSAGDGDLAATLSETLRQLIAGKSIEMNFRATGNPARLPGDIETNILRICQEAVSNVINHASARQVSVEMDFESALVRLRVSDDGCGFDPSLQPSVAGGHFGLIGMRERARKLGGHLSLRSAPGEGTELMVEIPVKAKANGGH